MDWFITIGVVWLVLVVGFWLLLGRSLHAPLPSSEFPEPPSLEGDEPLRT